MTWAKHRREPYTEIGVRRLRCVRCQLRWAAFQWQCCADGNNWRPLCQRCDVELNALVLEWMGHPEAAALSKRYAAEKLGAGVPT